MTLLEALITGICSAILKRAAVSIGLGPLVRAYEVLTLFTDLTSISDCRDLGVLGLRYGYEALTGRLISYVVNDVKSDEYAIEKTESGVYVARSRVVPGRLYLGTVEELLVQQTPLSSVGALEVPVRSVRVKSLGGKGE